MTKAVNDDVDHFTPIWRSFADAFAARSDSTSIFLEFESEGRASSWTVDEWKEACYATGEWLTALGAEPGDSIATLLGNTPQALAVAYACWIEGFCLVPLNPADSDERKRHILRDSGARVLIVEPRSHDDFVDSLASVGIVVASGAEVLLRAPGHSLETHDKVEVGLEQAAALIYTSGTTGDPKGVQLSIRNLLVHSDGLGTRLDWPGDTRVFLVLPVHHVNGLLISSLLPWLAGWSVVMRPRFDASTFWADFERSGATVCSVVPTILELLLRRPGGPTPGSVREILTGAGPLMPSTAAAFEARFDVPLRHLYGLSETSAVSCLMPLLNAESRLHWATAFGFPSVGPAIDHAEVRIASTSGEPVIAGERGELQVRGAIVMGGYAHRPAETAEAFDGGWLRTGDEGFWQEGPDGVPYFFITGRRKEIIIRGGVNISPLEIDEVLMRFPGVDIALSFGFEHDVFGEEVAAYVVASREIDPVALSRFCAQFLDAARRPKLYVFGEDVPYTVTGKAKRIQLRDQWTSALQRFRETRFSSDPDEIEFIAGRRSQLAGQEVLNELRP